MYVDIENRPIKGDDRYSVPGVPGEPYPINTKEDKTGAKRHPPVPSETRSILASTVGVTGSRTVRHRRRARYTPIRMMAPPTIFSMLRTSPKKMRPEATPVMVIRY
jgi:hypothetical protein